MSTYIVNDNGINRNMTADEAAAYESATAQLLEEIAKTEAAKQASSAARVSALAKLKALGLTDAEIAALVG